MKNCLEECKLTCRTGIPAEAVFEAQLGEGPGRWKIQPSIIEDLKRKAKSLGIWNIFLPKNHYTDGAGFSNLEYGLMAEHLGRSVIASEVRPSMSKLCKKKNKKAESSVQGLQL